ncbi:MAG: DUF2637 domain-containing protein [Micromonosporaceae bacterium]
MTAEHTHDGHHTPEIAPGAVSDANRVEGVAQIVIMLAIGCAAGAASFTHVHNVAAAHGQGGWLAWADAVVLELMSIASGLELRRRRRLNMSVQFPAAVLVCAVALSIAAQVLDAEPSVVGWLAAALPALGFLVMVKIALGRTPVGGPERPSHAARSACPAQPDTLTNGRTAVPDNVATAPLVSALSGTCRTRDQDGSGTGPTSATHTLDPTTRVRVPEATDVADVADLLPAARSAHAALNAEGRPLSRPALAEHLRSAGHAVSNARASVLVKILKADGTGADNGGAPCPQPSVLDGPVGLARTGRALA